VFGSHLSDAVATSWS